MNIYINGRFLTQDITGVQRYGHELLRSLDLAHDPRSDKRIVVLTPRRGLRFESQLRNIELRKVGRAQGHVWEQTELALHSGDGVLFCPGNSAPLASLALRRRTVVAVHDLSFKYFPQAYSPAFRALYGALMPMILRLASRIITVSQSEVAAITRHYPHVADRTVAIQNGGFGPDILPQIPQLPPAQVGFPYGLYVGSLSKRKNFPLLLRAAVHLARVTDHGFVFVGSIPPGLQRSGMEVPDEVRHKILFRGQTNDPLQLVRWYKGASFLAFPSLYEASPFPPIEAMSCGCPVIASRIPSLLERCADAALYCDPHDERDVAEAMMRLARDARARAELVARGAAQARRFSWSANAHSTYEVLRSVASAETAAVSVRGE